MASVTPQSADILAAVTSWAARLIESRLGRAGEDERDRSQAAAAAEAAWEGAIHLLGQAPAQPLARLLERHGLTGHERRVILFLLATRVDASVAKALSLLRGVDVHRAPTVRDIVHVLGGEDSAWTRAHAILLLDPANSLVRRGLCEVFVDPHQLTSSAFTLTTAALTEALGLPLGTPFVRHIAVRDLGPSDTRAASPIFAALARAREHGHFWVFRFGRAPWHLIWSESGEVADDAATRHAVDTYGGAVVVDGLAVAASTDPARVVLEALQLATLKSSALVLRGGDALLAAATTRGHILAATRDEGPPVFVAAASRRLAGLDGVWSLVHHVPVRLVESADTWLDGLAHFGQRIDRASALALSEDLRLDSPTVGRVLANAAALASAGQGPFDLELIKRTANAELEVGSSGLARHIVPSHGLDEVIVAPEFKSRLRAVVEAAAGWFDLLGHWGFGRLMSTGRAVTCLFSGDPGTGKTHSAEAIAKELGRPLLMASVPGLTSKWMGETERNLRDLFAAARSQRAVLLFDEADTLFGSRVEAKSSHDHDRNMQTGAILQELDRHSGLVILTSNLSKNIDRAFQRRMMFALDFPFPETKARLALWRHLMPSEARVDADISWEDLAREFELSGGEIRNVILRAAAEAWSSGTAISDLMLRSSAILEYQRLGRLVSTR